LLGIAREHGAGEPILRAVGNGQRVGEIFGLDHRHDRSEDLLLGNAGSRGHVDEYRRLYVVAGAVTGFSARHQAALGLADLDVFKDLLPGDRKSTRLNSSHVSISYAVFCLKKKNQETRS